MSVQIFLQGHLLGTEEYLRSGDPAESARRISQWTEELPARFLAERGLSPILMGSSGGGQFLMVLPAELREPALAYFDAAAPEIRSVSNGALRMVVSATENLGSWKLIRDRLNREHRAKANAPGGADFAALPRKALEGLGVPPEDILRGDVDNFSFVLDRAESIEAFVSLNVLFKQFFAGEASRLAQGRARVLWTGGDEFAIAGKWVDSIEIAAELRRLFERFVSENLNDTAGPEGKTISMALALAHEGETLGEVFGICGRKLAEAKSITRDGFHLFGRVLDWKQFPETVGIKDRALRLVREFGCSTQFLDELRGFYPEVQAGRRRVEKADRPWRLYRRLAVTLDPQGRRAQSREFEKLKDTLAAEIVGRNIGQARLRPSGRVAIDWASALAKE
jgi:hypothetical protein